MKLMDEGYSENKAFEMVESEMVSLFDRQREENRILRGFALNNRARSYLNYSQQLAEVEGRAKVQQMERDLNKYITQENRWSDIMAGTQESSQKKLIENSESMLNDKFKELDYSKDSIEQFFTMYTPTSKAHPKNDPKSYEPALYQIINHPKDLKDSESLIDIQRGFINRSEKLLAMHRERSTINDGLKGLNDKEIIQKIREVPTKIKRNAKSLLKKLEKFNLKLDNEGNVDYSGIPYPQLVKSLKKMDTLVKIALMEKDLQFEYPQHLEKAKIKGDILMIANAEESKLNKMEHEREIREMQMNELNYEQYFGCFTSNDVKDIREITHEEGLFKKKGTYEEFVKINASKHIFENDILEKSYKFWEAPHEREKRLREIWIDLKRKNAIGGPDARTTNEQLALQEAIIDKIRDIRWKVDQEMVKHNLDPLFKYAYSKYTREEFLLDSEIQFSKLKTFLQKNPRILKEDSIISQEYLTIINLIRRKKLLEYASPAFSREHEESFESQKTYKMKKEKERQTQIEERDYDLERLDPYGDANDDFSINESSTPSSEKIKGDSKTDGLLKQFQQIIKKK